MTRGRSSRFCRPSTPDAAFADAGPPAAAALAASSISSCRHRYAGDDAERLAPARRARRAPPAPRPLATNDVHYHHPDRRPLQDVVTCIREHARIAEAAPLLFANAERHLKPPAEMARLFRDYPQALESSLEILERCRFSLDELAYDYPVQDSYDGRTPDQELARRAWAGAAERYPDHLPEKVEPADRGTSSS